MRHTLVTQCAWAARGGAFRSSRLEKPDEHARLVCSSLIASVPAKEERRSSGQVTSQCAADLSFPARAQRIGSKRRQAFWPYEPRRPGGTGKQR